MKTIRLLISIMTQFKWSILQMDVKPTLLNKFLEEEVYVNQPKGYVKKYHEEKV